MNKYSGVWRFESDDVVTTMESTDLLRLIHDISFLYKFNEKLTDALIDNGTQTVEMRKGDGQIIRGRFLKIS